MAKLILMGYKSDHSRSRGVGETKERDYFFSDKQVKQMIEYAVGLYIRTKCLNNIDNEGVAVSRMEAKEFVKGYVK